MTPGDGTIAAIATPPGRGGIGMLRISGPRAAAVAGALFRRRHGSGAPAHGRATFGEALDADGAPLDRGVLTLFRAPRSYTGEDTAEITIHGSGFLLRRLLDAAVRAGARPAEPGEFTWRAFRSGRLDLAQAEAVSDLIEATTAEAARVAFLHAEGALVRGLAPARAALVDLIARLEASLEFSEEDGTALDAAGIGRALESIRAVLAPLAGSFQRGRRLREGFTTVLAGAPNAGKSSLFNLLVGHDRAIVTPIPGTTRDSISETLEIDGVPVRLLDTAGLGAPQDAVEAEGVRRAEEARRDADLVLFVTDGARPALPEEAEALYRSPPGTILVRNKSDLPAAAGGISGNGWTEVVVSARTGEGMADLRRAIAVRLGGDSGTQGATVVEAPLTRERQYRHVAEALESVDRAAAAHAARAGEELIVFELQSARDALGRATGEIDIDDVYDVIFSAFCIGK